MMSQKQRSAFLVADFDSVTYSASSPCIVPLSGYTKHWNDLAGELEKWLKTHDSALASLKVDYGDEQSLNAAIDHLKVRPSSLKPGALRTTAEMISLSVFCIRGACPLRVFVEPLACIFFSLYKFVTCFDVRTVHL